MSMRSSRSALVGVAVQVWGRRASLLHLAAVCDRQNLLRALLARPLQLFVGSCLHLQHQRVFRAVPTIWCISSASKGPQTRQTCSPIWCCYNAHLVIQTV